MRFRNGQETGLFPPAWFLAEVLSDRADGLRRRVFVVAAMESLFLPHRRRMNRAAQSVDNCCNLSIILVLPWWRNGIRSRLRTCAGYGVEVRVLSRASGQGRTPDQI